MSREQYRWLLQILNIAKARALRRTSPIHREENRHMFAVMDAITAQTPLERSQSLPDRRSLVG